MLAAPPSLAVLNSPNAKIPRTPDAALRRSVPAFNSNVAAVQKGLEEVAFLLRIPQRKPWGSMAANVASAITAVTDKRQQLLDGVPPSELAGAEQLLDDTLAKLKQLELAVRTQQPDFVGVRVADVLQRLAKLELLQAPGLPFSIPREYAARPRLLGRATVEVTLEKADGALAFVDSVNGGVSARGKVQITLDGYSAPISAGNFAANVVDHLYDGSPLQVSYSSVIVPGPETTSRPPIPLEILPAGEFDPLYRLPLDVQAGELPVLPLSISGAVSMTHAADDSDAFLDGAQWFIFKFDKQQAGLSGLAFDEGRFGVFGYVTQGMDVVSRLQSGDVIVEARLLDGADKLVRDTSSSGSSSSAGSSAVSGPTAAPPVEFPAQ